MKDVKTELPPVLWIGENSTQARNDVKQRIGQAPVVLFGKAVEMLPLLGIDSPEAIKTEPIEKVEGLWDKRGFQSYRNHPIFDRLHGGFYSTLLDVLTPPYGEVSLYQGEKAKILAVEKRYIDYLRNRAVIWEYPVEKVLCIGGFIYPERQKHYPYETLVDQFRANVETYMLRRSNEEYPVWPSISGGFSEVSPVFGGMTLERIREMPAPSPLRMTLAKNQTGYYTNTSGSRILVNARDDGSIQEVWAHPYRIIKKIDIEIDGKPLPSLLKKTILEPAYVQFETENASVVVFAGIDKPLLGIQLDVQDTETHEITLRYETDLRISWPMDDDYSGKRHYSKEPDSGSVCFWTADHRCSVCIKTDRPAQIDGIAEGNLWQGTLKYTMQKSFCVVLCAAIEGEEFPKNISFDGEIHRSKEYYQDYLEQTIKIQTDLPDLNRHIAQAMIATLKFRAETPPLGTGILAGFANSRPGWNRSRPGYAWYFGRDSEWISLAFLSWGDAETVRENLELLIRYQELTGKIYHELSTSGVVHYDAADSTPLFLLTAIQYLKHTGNIEWYKRYKNNIIQAVKYCASTDTDGDGCIENTIAGHGWIEGGGLYLSHASLYLNVIWHAALKEWIALLPSLDENPGFLEDLSLYYQKVDRMLPKFFNHEKMRYGLGIDKQGNRIDYFAVLPSVGIYLRNLSGPIALAHTSDFSRNDCSTDWGVRMIGKSSGVYNPGGYHEGSVWPLFTGMAALSEFATGTTLSGFTHVCASLNDSDYYAKGYIHEVLHGEVYKSAGVCPHQGWSESMAVLPLTEGVIGFFPNALKESLTLSPQIPANLSQLSVTGMKCGGANVTMDYERKQVVGAMVEVRQRYRIRSDKPLNLDFSPYIPKQSGPIAVSVRFRHTERDNESLIPETVYRYKSCDDLPVSDRGNHSVKISLPTDRLMGEMVVEITYQTPFELKAVIPVFIEQEPSRLPRILGWEKRNGRWAIEIEAPGNREVTLEGFIGKRCYVKGAIYHEGRLYCRAEGAEYEYHPHTIEIEG
ncbi:MAG TPA: hypothetical protein PLO74_02850 [Thermotogota bacterium]|nr:hypothetical protein [Thermotogota bacterium]